MSVLIRGRKGIKGRKKGLNAITETKDPWTVRCIVEALGGEIRVESEPGIGSCFSMSLPRKPDL
jgi:sensor histidine kinase regulating citrate/malate metabolism